MPQFEQTAVFTPLLFWSLISFAIFLFLLWKFAFPPILKALEERTSKIRTDIQSAEDLKVEAEKLKLDFEAQLKTAQEKAATIVSLAQEEARKISEKTISDTQAKCRQIQKDAEHEILTSRNQLMSEIRDYISVLTVASTEKVLRRTLSDDDKKRLIDESIEEVLSNLEQNA